MSDRDNDMLASRRHAMRLFGGVAMVTGGLSLLSACGSDDDNAGPTAGVTPTPSPSPTAPGPLAPGPTYTANDSDRMNFALQINYLFAAYLFRGVFGTTLPAGSTSGTGASGSVTGGSRVALTDPVADNLREIAYNVQAQIGYLRRVLGGATTAQPAISIAGGTSGPFQAIASTTAFPAAAPFDPYASEINFLIGAVALADVIGGAMIDVVRQISDATQRGVLSGLVTAAAQHDVMIRFELFLRGQTDTKLYNTLNQMSDARDAFDSSQMDLDQGIGNSTNFNIIATNNGSTVRRTPEQVLGILFANQASVTSGAFFPSGINGVIRASGSNRA